MLLRTLEYRGYDSTGAAIQREDGTIDLRKGVGPPSQLVTELGIVDQKGIVFCGQVRWATFGAVTKENAQPHEVRCKVHVYGAHNGNVTNCDALKAWLQGEGHDVRSDNDGEMVVHTIEHEFAREVAALADPKTTDRNERAAAMRRAIVAGARRLEGSFAAVIVDPITRVAFAIKQGSSLYFGVGTKENGGAFGLASSDLSSILKMTRTLLPLREGEFVEFDATSYRVYAVADGSAIARAAARSKLRVEDTALDSRFTSFMEQEIEAQPRTVKTIFDLLSGGSHLARQVSSSLERLGAGAAEKVRSGIESLRDDPSAAKLTALADLAETKALASAIAPDLFAGTTMASSDAAVFGDLLTTARSPEEKTIARIADAIVLRDEAVEFEAVVERFADLVLQSSERRGRVLVLSCGSSYNAACTGALFWNELAGVEIVPLLPGQFRERLSRTLRDGDLVVTISQSGETKDLVDVLDDIIASRLDVKRIGIVNNVNSTIPQEKSDLVVPLRCGPEIAVPATKSFTAQLALLYGVALRVAERRSKSGAVDPALVQRRKDLEKLPALLEETTRATSAAIEEAAQLLFQRPSLHLLATRLSGLAREGALKIREVVLDHAEGFEASEFKHGPNTLLGFNTLFGPDQLGDLVERMARANIDVSAQATALKQGVAGGLGGSALLEVLRRDYPLVFLTGPDARDVALTISQLNTHKIRGALPIVVAEEDVSLRRAAEKPPADNPGYRFVYIQLPKTGDTMMTAFTATIALQRLALRMSALKSTYLDGLGIPEHGVHPDVPKNVSKSITVD